MGPFPGPKIGPHLLKLSQQDCVGTFMTRSVVFSHTAYTASMYQKGRPNHFCCFGLAPKIDFASNLHHYMDYQLATYTDDVRRTPVAGCNRPTQKRKNENWGATG